MNRPAVLKPRHSRRRLTVHKIVASDCRTYIRHHMVTRRMYELKNRFGRDHCSSREEADPPGIADHSAVYRKQELVDVQHVVVNHDLIRTDTHAQMSFTAHGIKEGVMGTKEFSKHRIAEAGSNCINQAVEHSDSFVQ